MAKILMIIPPERFRDEELFITKEELERDGHEVTVSSTRIGKVSGSRGGFANSVASIHEVDHHPFDAVVFVGGGGSRLLFNNEDAFRVAREMHRQKKVVAAICLAPVILANAGILKGKKATVAGTEANTIEKEGASYTGPGVMVDGNVVTANAPKASGQFAREICALLKGAGRKGGVR